MKKLLLIIPALALIFAISSCNNKAKYSPASANAIGKMFAQGDTAHLEVATLKAKPRKHTYKVCGTDSTYKTVQRFDAVPDTFKMDYVVQGAEINIDSALAAQGLKIVSINTPTTDQQQTATTASITPDPQPVVVPEPETPTKPWDFTRFWDILKLIAAVLAVLAMLALAIWALISLINLLRRNTVQPGSRERFVENPNNRGNNFSDGIQPIVERRSGSAKYTAGAGVKKTVIEEKRTITHYYDDNRS